MSLETDNWLKAMHQDNTLAFEAFYQAYHLSLYRFILALLEQPPLAGEVLHRIMLDVWHNPKSLVGTTDIKQELFQRGWHQLNQQPHHQHKLHRASVTHLTHPTPAQQHQLPESLRTCWHQLNLHERALIYLVFIENLDEIRIASILELPIHQITERLQQALERLRNGMLLPNSD